MRHVFGTAVAALLLVSGSAARAQVVYGDPIPGAVEFPPGASVVVGEGPGVAPFLQPPPYAAYMLPPSPSHPWAILPWTGIARNGLSSVELGSRYSPYGRHSFYSYYKAGTGPFPGVMRPYARFTNHGHQ